MPYGDANQIVDGKSRHADLSIRYHDWDFGTSYQGDAYKHLMDRLFRVMNFPTVGLIDGRFRKNWKIRWAAQEIETLKLAS